MVGAGRNASWVRRKWADEGFTEQEEVELKVGLQIGAP